GVDRVLVDVTNVTKKLNFLDLYVTTDDHAKLGPPRPRCAIVGSNNQKAEMEFIESVGRRRGMTVSAFVDKADALAWLME
ncbi:MAG: hypothetical protein PVF63_01245, partial [Gammaproteobacteria bacterium]